MLLPPPGPQYPPCIGGYWSSGWPRLDLAGKELPGFEGGLQLLLYRTDVTRLKVCLCGWGGGCKAVGAFGGAACLPPGGAGPSTAPFTLHHKPHWGLPLPPPRPPLLAP